MYTGTLASSIVLMMDLFHAIDHDRPADEIKDVRASFLLKASSAILTRTILLIAEA